MNHWKALEPLIVEDALRALRELMEQNPDDRFYVAAFHGVYRECDGVITLPSLGANAVSARENEDQSSDDFWDADWNPADWAHELVDFESDALQQAADTADKAARQGSRADWLQAEKDCFDMLVSASQKVREALGDAPQLTPDFVMFVNDEEYATALARRCLGDASFERIFKKDARDDRERARVAALPVAERVEFLVARLDREVGAIGSEEARKQLAAIGAPAVPALLARMGDGKGKSKRGWDSALLLGSIGVATPEVLDALKTQMAKSRDEPGRAWAARALAYLGQSDWLLAQLAQQPQHADSLPDAARMAVEGLCAPYSSFRDPTPLPLDYGPLQALLEGPPATVALALDILSPGSGYCAMRPGEVDEVLRGLASPHAFMRRHAANLCWERGVGSAIGQRVLPVLAERLLKDDDADVRWTAAMAIGEWKAEGLPWHAAVAHAAQHDTNERVRTAAQSVLKGED